MRLSKRIKRKLTFFVATSILFVVNHIPQSLSNFLGSLTGIIAWLLLGKERDKIFRHLAAAYGDEITDKEKKIISRKFFVHTGKNIFDMFRFKKHYATKLKPNIEVEGIEFFERAYKRGKGLIGVTGHIGNFELLAVHVQSLGYDIAVIGRELYDKDIDKLLIDNREAMGVTNISTEDSPKIILKWLRDGKALGVLMDNDSFRVRSKFVPFFGRMANTPIGQSVLGLKMGAAFVPMACIRTDEDRYKIIIKPEVIISRSDDFDADVLEMTKLCSLEIEGIIREYPEQWAWVHNRWHTRTEESLDNQPI